MDFSAILKRAYQITRRHPALWLFGALLALFSIGSGGGGGGGGSQTTQAMQYRINSSDLAGLRLPHIDGATALAIILALAVVALALLVVSVILRFTSLGALIGMVDEVERAGETSVHSGFRQGWARFLRLFGIALAVDVPTVIVILALLLFVASPLIFVLIGRSQSLPALTAVGIILMVGLFVLWLLITIALLAATDLLKELAYRRCVLALEGVRAAIAEGYRMGRRNLRDAGLMWLIQFGVRLLVGIALIPIGLLLLIVLGAPALLAWLVAQRIVAALIVGLPLLGVFIAAIIFIRGLYLVFQSAAWTLTYREILAREGTGGEGQARTPVRRGRPA